MKDGVLERIRAIGHWRVVARPLRPLAEKLLLQSCFDEVNRARVSIRGWDYPHIDRRGDQYGGTERCGDYIESWCDWKMQLEFWRMYRSGQFLSYAALDDDMERLETEQPTRRFLNVVRAIYSIAEFVEFAYRLALGALYRDGLELSVTLNGTEGRGLAAGANRMPFFELRATQATSVTVIRRLDQAAIEQGAIVIAKGILLEFFDHFGWNPEPNRIRADLEAFYRREFR